MKKLLAIAFIAFATVACNKEIDQVGSAESKDYKFQEICIKNVVYYYRHHGNGKMLAPKYDSETKEIVTCDETKY